MNEIKIGVYYSMLLWLSLKHSWINRRTTALTVRTTLPQSETNDCAVVLWNKTAKLVWHCSWFAWVFLSVLNGFVLFEGKSPLKKCLTFDGLSRLMCSTSPHEFVVRLVTHITGYIIIQWWSTHIAIALRWRICGNSHSIFLNDPVLQFSQTGYRNEGMNL